MAAATVSEQKKREKRQRRLLEQPQTPRTEHSHEGHSSPKRTRYERAESVEAVRVAGIDEAEQINMVKELGDDIDTRLRDMVFDDDLDNDVFDERRRELLEDARLAAGTQQRIVSTAMAELMRRTRRHDADETELSMLRVRHNCNAITAVACLGSDLVAFGDKSGRVYLADLTASASASSSASSSSTASGASPPSQTHAAAPDRRKFALVPAMASAVTAIALSDTRQRRPTTRDLLEKSTVDMSCPSYLAVGSVDGSIGVWKTHTRDYQGLLSMHHKPVTGLCFRRDTATLLSCSVDSTLRVWSVPQMMCQDKLYGHTGAMAGVHALRRETCATVGNDGTMRFWKLDTAMQQAYDYLLQHREDANVAVAHRTITVNNTNNNNNNANADATSNRLPKSAARTRIALTCVAMLNESIIVAGAVDGTVLVFDVNRRKPLVMQRAAHGEGFVGDGTGLERTAVRAQSAMNDSTHHTHDNHTSDEEQKSTANGTARVRRNANPITAVAAVSYGDVVASASYDGWVRLWQLSGVGSGMAVAGKPADAVEESAATRTSSSSSSGASHTRFNQPGAHAHTQAPQLIALTEIPVEALVTSLVFSEAGDVLCVGCSKEPRDGRWVVMRRALNSVCVVPLTASAVTKLRRGGSCVEHVPALLYRTKKASAEHDDAKDEDDSDSDEGASAKDEYREGEAEDTEDSDRDGVEQLLEEDQSDNSILKCGEDGQLVLDDRVLWGKERVSGDEEVRTRSVRDEPPMRKTTKNTKAKKSATRAMAVVVGDGAASTANEGHTRSLSASRADSSMTTTKTKKTIKIMRKAAREEKSGAEAAQMGKAVSKTKKKLSAHTSSTEVAKKVAKKKSALKKK